MRQHGGHFITAQHDGEASRALRAHQALEPWEVDVQDTTVQEQERGQRLILCGGAHPRGDREMREEARHFGPSKFGRVSLPVEENVATDPEDVRFLGSGAQVPGANRLSNTGQKPRTTGRRGRAISAAPNPSPLSTSSVCSPKRAGGVRIDAGVSESLIGGPGIMLLPSPTTIPRWRTCGSANVSSSVLTGPKQISFSPSSALHSASVFVRNAARKKRNISSRFSPSSHCTAMKSSRPKWRQSVVQKCSSYAPT